LGQPDRRRCQPAAGRQLLVAERPWAADLRAATASAGLLATSGRGLVTVMRLGPDRWLTREPIGLFPFLIFFKFLPALYFLHKWSTLSHWLQHMPALPRLLLETSNIHNF
jgi:hypothetical protein